MTLSRYIKRSTLALAAAIGLLMGCDGNDYDGVTVTFYSSLAGQMNEPEINKSVDPVLITLKTSRILWEDSQVNVRIEGNGAGYGYSYATQPAMLEPGIITLTIPAGESTASFTFQPINDGVFEPFDYDYTFHIDQTNGLIESVGQANYSMKVIDSTEPFVAFDFENCPTNFSQFTEEIVEGGGVMAATSWKCYTLNNANKDDASTGAIMANAYGRGNGTSNSYLVFPAIDGERYSTVYLSMIVKSLHSGAGNVRVVYSTNYKGTDNPEAEGVIWMEMADLNGMLPGGGSIKWTPVEGLIRGIDGGKLYIAIQYKGGQSASASDWLFDDVQLKGN